MRFSVTDIFAERYVLWDQVGRSAPTASTSGSTIPDPPAADDDDAAEGSRPDAASSVNKGDRGDLSRSNEAGPPRKKQRGDDGKERGQNKGRTFKKAKDEGAKLCANTARGLECTRKETTGNDCHSSHNLKQYLSENQQEDIQLDRPDKDGAQQQLCPVSSIPSASATGHCASSDL